MSAYVDCLACACLIRAREQSCPFCGTSQRHAPAPPALLGLGLTLGMGLTLFGCGDKEGGSETVNSSVADTYEADAVTYGGPDSFTDTAPGEDTIQPGGTTTTTTWDTQEADAVTYGGPDESTSISSSTTFTETESDSTTDTSGTASGSSGTSTSG